MAAGEHGAWAEQLTVVLFGQPEAGGRPFSRAARAGGLVFVSGQSAPHDPGRGVVRGETVAEEVRGALGAMAAALAEAGCGMGDVAQVTMLIREPSDYAACNAEYVRHFPGGLPARHTARFGVPTEARVAFACVAVVAGGSPAT